MFMTHSEVHARAAERLRHFTERSNAAHRRYLDDPELFAHYEAFVDWQTHYMSSFFDDLRISPDCDAAIDFFISDLTGIGISRRDEDFARVVHIMVRMLPERALVTLAEAMEVNARALEMNIGICLELDRAPEDFASLSEREYCRACRHHSKLPDAMELVDMMHDVGHSLDRLIRIPLMGATLRAMRWPARMAGFGSLQEFLESGYRRFHEIDDPGQFLDDLATRVGVVFERVYGERLENLEGDW
jgi:hypothetical protein